MRILLALLLSLSLASAAIANDPEDENWGSSIVGGTVTRGSLRLIYAGLLCSNMDSADSNCSVFDFTNTNSKGMGDVIVLHMYRDGGGFDCTAAGLCTAGGNGTDSCTVTPRVTFSTAQKLGVGNIPPMVGGGPELESRPVAVTSFVEYLAPTLTLETSQTPVSRYLFTELTNMTNCVDLDLTIEIYEYRQ